MHERTARFAASVIGVDEQLEREFEAQLVQSSKLVFRIAFSVLRHREDAEDVAQEAFVKAHGRFRQLRDPERFRGWIVRLTWRLALNRQRADRRRMSRDLRSESTQEPTAEETLASRERAVQLWQAIDALPEKLRLVTVLASIEGHDVREVSRLLGLSEGTVKSRLFLSRQRLKEHLIWTRSEPTQ
jgi:RNA polymerase sigma-70 factor (ECF subfamily)